MYVSDIKKWIGLHINRILIVFGAFLLIIGFFYYVVSPLNIIYRHTKLLPNKIRDIKTSVAAQDFEFLSFEIDYLKEDLIAIDKAADRMQPFSYLPFIGDYFRDLKNISSSSIEMVDISVQLFSSIESVIPNFRFKGWGIVGDSSSEASSEAALTQISAVLTKELPNYKSRLFSISKKLEEIDSQRYPRTFKGINVRAGLDEVKGLSSVIINSFGDITTLIEILPDLSGANSPKNYLIVLENNNQIRPGGGILSAYAVFNVRGGKVKISKSGDVVLLDSQSGNIITAPDSVKKYLNINNLYLKDAAYSPDLSVSATAIKNAWLNETENYPIDGVIVLDNHFILSLFRELEGENSEKTLDMTNKLNSFSLSVGKSDELNKESKGFMATLFYSMIQKTFSTSMQKRADLLKTIFDEASQKHISAYFFANTKFQSILNSYNFGGEIKNGTGDYLLISNFNINSDVSNNDIKKEVRKEVLIQDGKTISTLSLTFTNSSNNSQGAYKNFVRVYVPKGSRLISTDGSIQNVVSGEDIGKSFFEGYLEIPAGTQAVFTLKYEVSNLFSDGIYKLTVQKQLGGDSMNFAVNTPKANTRFELLKDIEIQLDI